MKNDHLGLLLPPPFLRTKRSKENDNGAEIASIECCRALLSHRMEEEISLFLPENLIWERSNDVDYLALTEEGFNAAVALTPLSAMEDRLRSSTLTAMHTMDANALDTLSYVRSTLSKRLFPITCMQYGFTYQVLLRRMAMRLLWTPTYPCDALIVTSETAKKGTNNILGRLREEFKARFGVSRQQSEFQVKVIPHGVDVEIYKPRDKYQTRRFLELPLHKIMLLYAGRVDPNSKSDLTPMLMAVQNLVKKHGDRIFLVIAGPIIGDYRQKLNYAIGQLGLSGHVVFRDNVPANNICLYYSAADIFVSLSDTPQENFGLTPVEAMSSGLPVVVSDWAGYKETVVHNQTGFRVKTTWSDCDEDLCKLAAVYEWDVDHFYLSQSVVVSVDETTNYLDALITNESLRLEMGENARAHVVANYSWRRCVELFWDLWHDLNETARSLRPVADEPQELMRPHYFEDFGSFSTRHLDITGFIRTTKRGLRVCAGHEKLLLLPEPRDLIKSDFIMKILRFVRFLNAVKVSMPLIEFETLFTRKHKISNVTMRRQIMWMLKYDLLNVTSETPIVP